MTENMKPDVSGEKETKFQSPLIADLTDPFSEYEFKPYPSNPSLDELRFRMNRLLFDLFELELPLEFRDEAESLLKAYCGGHDDFFSLFYVPSWSFLHWAEPSVASENAMQAHTLALFLHLWDDHLADGQIESNEVRTRMRSIAWNYFQMHSIELSKAVGASPSLFCIHAKIYEKSLLESRVENSVKSYCDRFHREIAIWTLIPYLCGFDIGGALMGNALSNMIKQFSSAWRVIDDLQDVLEDVATGSASVVPLVLDSKGKKLWKMCEDSSRQSGQLDQQLKGKLVTYIKENNYDQQILLLAQVAVNNASSFARETGFLELAAELVSGAPLKT